MNDPKSISISADATQWTSISATVASAAVIAAARNLNLEVYPPSQPMVQPQTTKPKRSHKKRKAAAAKGESIFDHVEILEQIPAEQPPDFYYDVSIKRADWLQKLAQVFGMVQTIRGEYLQRGNRVEGEYFLGTWFELGAQLSNPWKDWSSVHPQSLKLLFGTVEAFVDHVVKTHKKLTTKKA